MTASRSPAPWLPDVIALLGWVVLGLLVACAAVLRFRIAPIAVCEWDSWGWLHPALSWLGGLGFREQFEREWLYGAFLAGCLKFTGSFSGFVVIQQVLGLFAGVLMWLTWRNWVTLFAGEALFEAAAAVLGLFVVGVYLFSPIAMALELAVRPEGIMAFVAFLQLYCITSYCKFRWHAPRPVTATVFGALAIPLAYSLFVLKPNWLLAVPATTLPVVAGLFGTAAPLTLRLLTPLLGVILIFAAVVLPEKTLFVPTTETRLVLPMTLFTIHADVIEENMQRQFASQATPEDRRRALGEFLKVFEPEMQTARTLAKYYPRLGFDPDYLMYRSRVFPFLESTQGMSRQQIADFCRQSFLSAIWNEPVAYARKVLTQLGYFFFPDDATFFRKRIEMGKLYEYVRTTVPETLDQTFSKPVRDLYQTYRDNVLAQVDQPANIELFRPIMPFLRALAASAFAIEIAFFLSLAACLLFKPLARLRLPGLVALIFFLAPAGNALTIALIHALDNTRYRGSYGPLLLFALAGFLLFFLTTLAHASAHLKERRAQRRD